MSATFGNALIARLDHSAHSLAYSFTNENGQTTQVTYDALLRRALSIGYTMSQYAVRGDRVMLMLKPGIDYVAAFLGCCVFGFVSIPAYPLRKNQHARRTLNIISNATPALVVLDSSDDAFFAIASSDSAMPRVVCLDETATATFAAPLQDLITAAADDEHDSDLAFLQYTSGSTGHPKGTMVSFGNLLHNSEQMRLKFGTSSDSVMVSWLPPYHDMGLILGVLHPLIVGFPCHLMAPAAFIQRPLNWLRLIAETGATISGGPNFAYDLCVRRVAQLSGEALDLSTWKVAFNGAEPIQATTLRSFAEVFRPYGFDRRSLYPCYGLAENTLMASGQDTVIAPDSSPECFIRLDTEMSPHVETVHSGTSIDGQSLLIVDPTSRLQRPLGEIGEIWISGQSVAQGYWGNEQDTINVFRAVLADSDDGRRFLRTGDLGQLIEGQLYIRGRIKDLIVIRGTKYFPQDIERTVEEAVSVIRPGGYCAVFQTDAVQPETIGVVVELRREDRKKDTQPLVGDIRSAVSREYGLRVSRVDFLQPGRFPKTSSGKIPRSVIQKQFIEETSSSTPVADPLNIEPVTDDLVS